jgi:hypothetical protein
MTTGLDTFKGSNDASVQLEVRTSAPQGSDSRFESGVGSRIRIPVFGIRTQANPNPNPEFWESNPSRVGIRWDSNLTPAMLTAIDESESRFESLANPESNPRIRIPISWDSNPSESESESLVLGVESYPSRDSIESESLHLGFVAEH